MTIKDQLNRLPIPYRDSALKNADKAWLNEQPNTVSHALFLAFSWYSTPQKEDFWGEVYLWVRYHIDGIQTSTEPPQLPPIP